MVTYSIAICNYNMEDTLEQSLRSVLDQVDEEYEVVVIDDGSDDDSPEILRRLGDEYDNLRFFLLDRDPDRELGATRNFSVEKSRGEYVILQVDADDVVRDAAITDFTHVFHEIEEKISREKLVVGECFQMAAKDFLEERGPYRNLPIGAEDLDLWRRTLAEDELIWVDSDALCDSLGYDPDTRGTMKRTFQIAVGDFQCGITFTSYLHHALREHSVKGAVYDFLMLPVAYLVAQQRESYSVPPQFRSKGARHYAMAKEKRTLDEIADRWNVEIDRTGLSDNGYFDSDDR